MSYFITQQRGVQRLLLELQEYGDGAIPHEVTYESLTFDERKELMPAERAMLTTVAIQGLIFSTAASNVFSGDSVGQALALVCASSFVPLMVSTLVSEEVITSVMTSRRMHSSLALPVVPSQVLSENLKRGQVMSLFQC